MGFEHFGRVSFTTEAKTVDFIKYLEQGKVMTTRCKKCGTSYFPPKLDCPSCLNSEVEWFEIEGKGKLVTYSVVQYGPSGFEDDAPYTLGIADFGDEMRIFGRLSKGIKADDIKPGMELKIVSTKSADGRIGYEFQKA
ncbi:MAG: Zn-ribbon domain-containing OB-fold protein [Dehalococcoidales bacterium]|nr:Zn-ribbon domain-containing OB-fold protein [Dehalococcoidales bacterium]